MKDILAHGRPTVKNLYSPKKTGFIPQIFSLNEKNGGKHLQTGFPAELNGGDNMKIGKRLRYFRKLRGMNQKTLGMKLGFPEDGADVRIAQYETCLRNPREKLLNALCAALDISPAALIAPQPETVTELMHTLFAIEDIYGITIKRDNYAFCLMIDPFEDEKKTALMPYFMEWYCKKQDLIFGRILKDEYDDWRYHFQEYKEESHAEGAR